MKLLRIDRNELANSIKTRNFFFEIKGEDAVFNFNTAESTHRTSDHRASDFRLSEDAVCGDSFHISLLLDDAGKHEICAAFEADRPEEIVAALTDSWYIMNEYFTKKYSIINGEKYKLEFILAGGHYRPQPKFVESEPARKPTIEISTPDFPAKWEVSSRSGFSFVADATPELISIFKSSKSDLEEKGIEYLSWAKKFYLK